KVNPTVHLGQVNKGGKKVNSTNGDSNISGKNVYVPYYDEAKELYEKNPEGYPNPDKSNIVKGQELKEARADYHAMTRRGELEKGHHIQGLSFGGKNIDSNIKKTGELNSKRKKMKELNLYFYHEMGNSTND